MQCQACSFNAILLLPIFSFLTDISMHFEVDGRTRPGRRDQVGCQIERTENDKQQEVGIGLSWAVEVSKLRPGNGENEILP